MWPRLPIALASLAQDAPSPTDRSALYASLSAVAVSLVGGAVAVITSSRSKTDTAVRYVDPPTSNNLPNALADLYEETVKEKHDALRIAALWESRARDLGWRDPTQ